MLDCHRRQEVRFVVASLYSIVTEGKKYDLSPICARLSQKWKKYDLLSPICARLSQKGRSTICCHQFVLDCHRREEVRFVATNLCSIVIEGKNYDLLPICARLSQKGRSTICCHQFVLDRHRREGVRFVATNLCSIVLDCVRLS